MSTSTPSKRVSIIEEPVTSSSRTSSTSSKSPSPKKSNSPEPGTSKGSPKEKRCPGCDETRDIVLKPELNRSALGQSGSVNTEFLYYSSTLREVAPQLTNELDRQMIIPWLRKLFRPEYHSSRFRDKRNMFLMYLTITILNDEAFGIFRNAPPTGALPEFYTLETDEITPQAQWEKDNMWKETLQGLPEDSRFMECSIHMEQAMCDADHDKDKVLDEEFAFLLYMARPLAGLIKQPEDRSRVASWLQTLCTITEESCCSMKILRNEYLMLLLGYMNDLRVAGPFIEFPRWKSLPPLIDVARRMPNPTGIDPLGPEAQDFFSIQPVPDEGAFCYIAVTGELLDSTLEEVD